MQSSRRLRIGRIPCAADRTDDRTGPCARMARGLTSVGDTVVSRSIIGGEFRIEAVRETRVADRIAVVPRITGSAYVYGSQSLWLSDDDPCLEGFVLSDTWGPQAGLLLE